MGLAPLRAFCLRLVSPPPPPTSPSHTQHSLTPPPPLPPPLIADYPDGRQEQLLQQHNAHLYADFLNIMSYDQQNTGHHSSLDFGSSTLRQGASILPVGKLCLGLPFYGRLEGSGEWMTYEVGGMLKKLGCCACCCCCCCCGSCYRTFFVAPFITFVTNLCLLILSLHKTLSP